MATLTLAARLPATASALAIAASFLAMPGVASAQASQLPVTASEEKQCDALATQQERDLCIQGKAADEGSPNQEGDLATLPPAAQAAQETEGGTIVVTGSRIRRTEFTSPDPIQVINPELGAREGKNQTVDLINSTPIAAGSTQITSAISSNFVTNGGEGAQTVSLRGLGAERTLILLNGRRLGPAGVRGAVASVDLNTIPSSIVSSIEILKTGASSIYGSDAVAGVVNVLTKRSTDGIELRGFTSVPEHGAAETYNVSATWGKEFERGHFIVTADYYRQNDLRRNDRKFLDCNEEFLTFTDGRRADIVELAHRQTGVQRRSRKRDPDQQRLHRIFPERWTKCAGRSERPATVRQPICDRERACPGGLRPDQLAARCERAVQFLWM